jgi:hypothetical protein
MAGRSDDKTHKAAIAKVGEAAEYAPEIRRHLAELVESPSFKGSHRAQVLLKYIVERALHGEFEGLRERTIGVEVFGRLAAYDTAEDAIVRVAASDVRKRLLKFYENAGSDLRFRIDLPSGFYVPEFQCLSAAAPEPPSHKRVDEEVPAVLPSVSLDRTSLPLRWLGALILAMLLLLAGGLAEWALGRRAPNRQLPADDFISAAFQGTSRGIQVIFGDEGLVQIQRLLGRDCTLSEYESLSYLREPKLVEQENLRGLLALLSKRQIVTIGDVQNAYRIRDNLGARGWEVAIRHARLANARDFRSGNFIILGSSFSNPWASLFQIQDSNFPIEDPRPPRKVPAYMNRHPAPGEPPSFGVELGTNGGKTVSHALVSLLENTSHTGRVMLIEGQSLAATEMAGEFLLRVESVSKMRGVLRLPERSPLPNLEMVLRVTEINEVGDSVELAACRKLPRRSN